MTKEQTKLLERIAIALERISDNLTDLTEMAEEANKPRVKIKKTK